MGRLVRNRYRGILGRGGDACVEGCLDGIAQFSVFVDEFDRAQDGNQRERHVDAFGCHFQFRNIFAFGIGNPGIEPGREVNIQIVQGNFPVGDVLAQRDMQFKYGGTFAPLEFGRKLREMYVAQDVDGDVIGIPAREVFLFHLIGRGGKGTGLGRYEDGIAGPILGKTHVMKGNVVPHLIVVPDGLQFGQFRAKGDRVDGFLERNGLCLDGYGLFFLVAGNARRKAEKGAGDIFQFSFHVCFLYKTSKFYTKVIHLFLFS